jgi:hypothetical protein
LNCLSFQIIEREFRNLDEVLIWVDRNQLGRRNLTDEQRAVVIGRLYKTVKQNPILNLKQFQKDNGDRVPNFGTRLGSAATARAIAEQVGVGKTTVRNAEKFADAVEALQTDNDDRDFKLKSRSGSDATAKAVAKATGEGAEDREDKLSSRKG